LPWVYVRRLIALDYHVEPWQVDLWPSEEVEIELAIRNLEGLVQKRYQRR
jgi:hypothetical protein